MSIADYLQMQQSMSGEAPQQEQTYLDILDEILANQQRMRSKMAPGGQAQGDYQDTGEYQSPGVTDVLGTARTGTSIYGKAGGESSLPLGWILAAIQGQHMMSSATDRRTDLSWVEGSHRTGDIFSGDFFTEPWMAYAYDKLGVDSPTPGEKTDASIDAIQDGENGWDNLLRSAPATGAQWFDPVGTFGQGYLEEKGGTLGKWAGRAAFPIQYLAGLLGDK